VPAAEPLLALEGVHASYGAVAALRGVSFTVGEGEIVTLIGANGAGKSTTLMAISGVLRPRGGDIRFAGSSLAGLRPDQVVRLGVSQVPEGRRIFPHLTVRENLALGAWARSDRAGAAADLEAVHGLFPVLAERASQAGGTLSGGEQQMLAIGRALMARPRLLLLDEPSLGLAPKVVEKIFLTIREINARGTTLLLVEQNALMALSIAHRGYVLEAGAVVHSGPAARLLGDPAVRAAYLGEDGAP